MPAAVCTMPSHLLLLLTLLGPGSSLQLWDSLKDGSQEAPAPALLRGRRQATTDEDFDEDYFPEVTDPPEMLENYMRFVSTDGEALSTMAVLEQRVAGPGPSEAATVEAVPSSTAGLDTGEAQWSTELATQWTPVSVDLTTEVTSGIAFTMEAVSTEWAPSMEATTREALSTGPVATKCIQAVAMAAETTQPSVLVTETTQPSATTIEATQPSTLVTETTQLSATTAETTPLAATEALPRTRLTQALFTALAATKGPSTEPTATTALSMEPVPTKSPSTEPITVTFLVPVVIHQNTTVTAGNLPDTSRNRQVVTLASSTSPGPTEASDRVPVRQCLLAILILAVVATVFLVCTVVLAIRLSHRNHMYPVRNYSPTEMVCISSLLPDGGEGFPSTANGGPPKRQGLKAEASEDRDGDDLTLHSFLP
ncbi:P-selectin glycoprotein ligand 1 isoform X2 [Castor canadensis]|uniref:P-selectin glycoprotein ligand 1 isoform X2 n=2 Tax=Castor canadensis TaxID=51338 RepID=A0AC58LHK9_CASCN